MAKAKNVDQLQTEYDAALEASQADPDDYEKRVAADTAGSAVTAARAKARQARSGVGVVAEGD